MNYTIKNSTTGKVVAVITTWDGRVTHASPEWQWTLGKYIQFVIGWLEDRNMTWEVTP